jgi:hypothetical protein
VSLYVDWTCDAGKGRGRGRGLGGRGGVVVNIQFRMQALLITVFVKPLNLFGSRGVPFFLVTRVRAGGSDPGRLQKILLSPPPKVFQN